MIRETTWGNMDLEKPHLKRGDHTVSLPWSYPTTARAVRGRVHMSVAEAPDTLVVGYGGGEDLGRGRSRA